MSAPAAGPVGVLLGGVAATWAWWTASEAPATADAGPLLALLAAVAAAGFVAWGVSRAVPWLPALVVAGSAAVVAVARRDTLLDTPLRNPLGYANATAAFYVAAAAAAVLVAVSVRARPVAVASLCLAVALALVPWSNGSETAAATTLLLPVALVGTRGRRAARAVVAGAAALVVVAVALTAVVGSSGSTDTAVADRLTERRVVLWRDAVDLIEAHPLRGVGPGRFREESPTAKSDIDALWAHNEFLQLGAETGVPGLALTIAAFGWAFALLWSAGDARAAIGAAALAAFGVHATLDYIGHFPAVVVSVAAVVGAAAAKPHRSGRPSAVP